MNNYGNDIGFFTEAALRKAQQPFLLATLDAKAGISLPKSPAQFPGFTLAA